MGFWTQPYSQRVGLVRKIRAGLLSGPFRLGLAGFRRLLEVGEGVERHRDEALGGRPCWYLNNLAVREDLRGKGIGGGLMQAQVRAMRERTPTPTRALTLTTQRPENVTFYRSHQSNRLWGHFGLMPRERTAPREQEPRPGADLPFAVSLNRETAKIANLCLILTL